LLYYKYIKNVYKMYKGEVHCRRPDDITKNCISDIQCNKIIYKVKKCIAYVLPLYTVHTLY